MAKAFYIGVGGVARKVKQPYIGVNSVARKVKKGYIGVNGVARQFLSGGTPISSLAVGSTLYLNENGSPIEYLVVHQGKPSSIYDDSCNGTWLLRQKLIEKRAWDSDKSSIYESSDIHSWLNSTMLAKYDANIKNVIKQVKIPYRANGGLNGSDKTGANGLSCKVFLLSGYEVGWYLSEETKFLPEDGAKLDYFYSDNGASAKNRRTAYFGNSANGWWLRTPYTGSGDLVWFVNNVGDTGQFTPTGTYGIRPALIMPSDTLINPSTNTIIT